MKEKICSKITQEEAKKIYQKYVNIRSLDSGYELSALVIDYCGETQYGIIVRINKKHQRFLNNNISIGESEVNPEEMIELDLRDIYDGDKFIFISEMTLQS